MRTKVKFLGILFITLLLGFAIGFLTHGIIIHEHFKKLDAMRQGDGVIRMIGERLKLTPSQKEATDPILKKYGDRLRTVHRHFNKELFATLDSLKLELQPFLSEEQNKLLAHRGFVPGFKAGRLPFFNNPQAHFMNHFLTAIKPADSQKDTVAAILKKYAPARKAGQALEPDSMHLRMQGLVRELKGVLSVEQFNRLLDVLPPDMPFDSAEK